MSSLRIAGLLVVVAAFLAASTARADGRICTTADTWSFGQQLVGSSTPAHVVVGNCGDAPFAFTDVGVHAATNAAFRVVTSCRTGLTLASGSTCDVDVFFEPKAPGQASGGLWLHNTTATPDQLLTFYARGIDAQAGTAALVFAPPNVDFGAAPVGAETPALVLTLTNAGSAPLVPSAFVLNGANPYDFRGELGPDAAACDVGRAIAPGGSCAVRLYFHPQADGLRRANLVIDAPQLSALAIVAIAGTGAAGASTIDVVEFHNADDDQYFLTADAREMALLDGGALGSGWSRTGMAFKAFPIDSRDPQAQSVCRFFGAPGIGPNSHFYTAYANECDALRKDAHWIEEGATFRATVPQDGACASGERAVARLWKPGADVTQTRHRYVTDPQVARQMQAQGWVLEGPVFCAPPG